MARQLKILFAAQAGISIRSHRDVPEALGATFGNDALIMTEQELSPEFFDLKTGIAGELFQKFQIYNMRLAIVVPAPERYGERFTELCREHKRHDRIRIVASRGDAESWLAD
jgi:hypothetical protein